jgi:hypothetical protein
MHVLLVKIFSNRKVKFFNVIKSLTLHRYRKFFTHSLHVYLIGFICYYHEAGNWILYAGCFNEAVTPLYYKVLHSKKLDFSKIHYETKFHIHSIEWHYCRPPQLLHTANMSSFYMAGNGKVWINVRNICVEIVIYFNLNQENRYVDTSDDVCS